MSPKFANVKAGLVSDVAGLVGERVNGWIRGYPSDATSSALKDGVVIKGRPVDWVWAIPGTVEYLVVEFSDSHKQYVARGELPELVSPAATRAAPPAVNPATRTTVASPVVVISQVKTEVPESAEQHAPSSNNEAEVMRDEAELPRDEGEALRDEGEALRDDGEALRDEGEALRDEAEELPVATEEPIPDLAFLADVARERVYAWIRSYRLSATSCALADGSRVPGRPVGWAWAVPGTVEYLVVEFSDGHKQYLSPADLPGLS